MPFVIGLLLIMIVLGLAGAAVWLAYPLRRRVDQLTGDVNSLQVALEELPMGLNPYKPTPPPPPKLYEKWWVWTAAAGALAIAVVVVVTPTVVLSNKDPVKDFGATYNFTISAAK